MKYDFIMLDVNKMGIMTSKSIILHFNGTIMLAHFSDERSTKWQRFGYSYSSKFNAYFSQIAGCFHLQIYADTVLRVL